jgi:DNA/RNA-binding protein KIN17
MLIAEQIERANAEREGSGSSEDSPPAEEGLKRDGGSEKVVLSFSTKLTPSTAPSTGLKLNPLKPKTNPLKLAANPLKQANAPSITTPAVGSKRHAPESAIEQLMFEDQERKRRRMDREAVV